MGSSPTKPEKELYIPENVNNKRPMTSETRNKIRSKVSVIANFKKHVNTAGPAHLPERKSTRELLKFVAERKKEKETLWEAVIEESQQENRFQVRPKTQKTSRMIAPEMNKTQVQAAITENQGICRICKKMATFDGYPCRVCDKTYHKQCLEGVASGKYSHGELDTFLANAKTPIGWSCYECDDISTLLFPKELQDIINSFEKYGVNEEAGITWEIFLKYHQFREDDLFVEDIDHLRTEFSLLDLDGDDKINWHEFLSHETGIKLSYREPGSLTELLSTKEVARARETFNHLDKDGDGLVVDDDVRWAFKAWYSRIDPNVQRQRRRYSIASVVKDMMNLSSSEKEPNILKLHVDNASNLVMEGDTTAKGFLTWDDYLCSQAVYILSSRPNRAIKINKSCR